MLVEKLMLNVVSEKSCVHIITDFIMKLLCKIYDTILAVVDRLTKMVHFVAIFERTLVEELARLFKDHMWKLYELPKNTISDLEDSRRF